MNAIELLKSQHRQVEKLLSKIEHAQDGRTARALFGRWRTAWPRTWPSRRASSIRRSRQRRRGHLARSLEEHLSLKRVLADFLKLPVGDETFAPKVKVLNEQVVHHHGEEEEELFPKVMKMLDAERLEGPRKKDERRVRDPSRRATARRRQLLLETKYAASL